MSLPSIKVQNLSITEQTQIPVTVGHVFARGDLMRADGLKAGAIPVQVDVKAKHDDGSVRHAILSWIHPKLKAGETASLQLAKVAPMDKYPDVDVAAVLQNLDARVVLNLAGQEYTASLKDADPRTLMVWLSAGQVVVEGFVTAPLTGAAGPHRLLEARFGVRYYPGAKQARVEFIVENTKTFTSAQKFNYDVELQLNGQTVYTRKGLDHYHHSRWHQYVWTGETPQVNVVFDPAYLMATKAVPNFDPAWAPRESDIVELSKIIGGTGPMTVGPVTWQMGTTGGRRDIGALPTWAVMWLLSQDVRARDVMMAAADGSGTWSVHWRDENTGFPVRTDNEKNKDISLHWNLRNRGPLPVPRYLNDDIGHSWSPYLDDTAHQPSLVFLPYIITGDHYYLEELQFWTVDNALGTDPDNSGHGKGLVRWLQLRGQAWSMRTLGQVAYITPDADPMKDYFVQQLNNNIDFYTDTYVKGQPNKLGAYDGSGYGAFNEVSGRNFAAWQDDFFTWAIGYLVELGFTQAKPLLKWKGQYSVARMTSPDMPWWLATTYSFKIRPSEQAPLFDSIGDIYKATYGGDTIPNDDGQQKSAIRNGIKFIDMPQYSQGQMDVLGAANGYQWTSGRMVGYADGAMGYPANLNPTLAVVHDSGIKDADKAYTTFMNRAAKPDYHIAPQWAILPRSLPADIKPPVVTIPTPVPITPVPAAPPQPDKNLAIDAKPADGVSGTWTKVADENVHAKVEKGAYVRYGYPGIGYVYAQAKTGEVDPTNTAFGKDPALNVVKALEVFIPTPPKVAGKLKLGSNKKLAKLSVTITVFDPYALREVKVFSQNLDSSGKATLSDSTITVGQMYGVRIADEKGNLLDTKLPILKAVK